MSLGDGGEVEHFGCSLTDLPRSHMAGQVVNAAWQPSGVNRILLGMARAYGTYGLYLPGVFKSLAFGQAQGTPTAETTLRKKAIGSDNVKPATGPS